MTMDQLYRCFSAEYQTGKVYRLVSENVRLRAYPSVGSCGKYVAVEVERRLLTRFSFVTGLSISVSMQFFFSFFLIFAEIQVLIDGRPKVSVTNENVITQQLCLCDMNVPVGWGFTCVMYFIGGYDTCGEVA
jgi:hypothetical protein